MGTGNFFAVDRRVWSKVCDLNKVNSAVAYLVLARGTQADLRTTSWSAKAIEERTALSWTAAKTAIQSLIEAGFIEKRRGGKKPRYFIRSFQDIHGIRVPMPVSDSAEAKLLAALLIAGSKGIMPPRARNRDPNWPEAVPLSAATTLCGLGLATRQSRGPFIAVDRPASDTGDDWIWLPNTIVDGADGETPPVDRLRATQRPATLRLFVDLYHTQSLASDGGVNRRHLRINYHRQKVGERGRYDVYAFWPTDEMTASSKSPFVAPHMRTLTQFEYANGLTGSEKAGWNEFWLALNLILKVGLAEFVPCLMEGETDEASIIHPLAHDGEGEAAERAVGIAAHHAGIAMLPAGSLYGSNVRVAPVERHIEQVCVTGLLRLRHRAQTAATATWYTRMDEWRAKSQEYQELEAAASRAYGDRLSS